MHLEPLVCFLFYILLLTTYLAWNEPMNGQNEIEMGRAQDVMCLEPLVHLLLFINYID